MGRGRPGPGGRRGADPAAGHGTDRPDRAHPHAGVHGLPHPCRHRPRPHPLPAQLLGGGSAARRPGAAEPARPRLHHHPRPDLRRRRLHHAGSAGRGGGGAGRGAADAGRPAPDLGARRPRRLQRRPRRPAAGPRPGAGDGRGRRPRRDPHPGTPGDPGRCRLDQVRGLGRVQLPLGRSQPADVQPGGDGHPGGHRRRPRCPGDPARLQRRGRPARGTGRGPQRRARQPRLGRDPGDDRGGRGLPRTDAVHDPRRRAAGGRRRLLGHQAAVQAAQVPGVPPRWWGPPSTWPPAR